MTDRYNPSSSSSPPQPTPIPECRSHRSGSPPSSQSLLEPDLINKLLNFLLDLNLKNNSDTNVSSSPRATSQPQTIPKAHEANITLPPEQSSSSGTELFSSSRSTPNHSTLTLDEFASELSQESFDESLNLVPDVSQTQNCLNFHAPTTQ